MKSYDIEVASEVDVISEINANISASSQVYKTFMRTIL